MSPTPSNPRHAAAWSFAKEIEDAQLRDVPATGQHRANLIHAFRKHLAKRFGR